MVDAGGLHTCAIRQNDTLWCWGYNDSGQIGVGDLVNRTTPTQTGCQPGQPAEACINNWQSISLGTFHSCAIRKGGELWCWGGNGNAQLGVGTTGTNERTPLRVNPPTVGQRSARATSTPARSARTAACGAGATAKTASSATANASAAIVPSKVISPSGGGRWEQVAAAAGGGPGQRRSHLCVCATIARFGAGEETTTASSASGSPAPNGVVTPRRVCFPAP